MSRISSSQRIVLSLGLVVLASATLTSGASAFHFGGGHMGGFGGGAHVAPAHFAPMGGNHVVGNIHGLINHPPMHLPPAAFHGPAHMPIHFVPNHLMPFHPTPIHFNPGSHPPIGHGPWHPMPPIGHGPHWPWHPLPIPVGGPIIPVGGPIVPVPVIDPIVPVPVDGGVMPVAQGAGYVASSVTAAAPTCGISGSFVAITFVPTVTATDITTFLKTYNVTMADGPTVDGVYRIRLSATAIPQSRIDQVIASMRTQTAIISAVSGA